MNEGLAAFAVYVVRLLVAYGFVDPPLLLLPELLRFVTEDLRRLDFKLSNKTPVVGYVFGGGGGVGSGDGFDGLLF